MGRRPSLCTGSAKWPSCSTRKRQMIAEINAKRAADPHKQLGQDAAKERLRTRLLARRIITDLE